MELLMRLTMDAEQKRLIELRRTERDLRVTRQAEISRAARERQIALVRDLKARMEFECSAYTEEIAEIESRRLIRRAQKQLISENDIQLEAPYQSHWREGPFGNRFLLPDSMRKLAREVKDAEASARDVRMKYVSQWASLVFGLMGLTTGLVSLLTRVR